VGQRGAHHSAVVKLRGGKYITRKRQGGSKQHTTPSRKSGDREDGNWDMLNSNRSLAGTVRSMAKRRVERKNI